MKISAYTQSSNIRSVNQITYHPNGGSYESSINQQYPFTTYAKYNRIGNGNDYSALVWVEYKLTPGSTRVLSTDRIEVYNEQEKIKAKEFLQKQVVERIELSKGISGGTVSSMYGVVQILSNGGQGLDGIIPEYRGASKGHIESSIEYFSNIIFENLLTNDYQFRDGYVAEYTRQSQNSIQERELSLGRSVTQSEKDKIVQESIKGVKQGMIVATKDYILQYYELAQSLGQLNLVDITNGLKGAWGKIKDPVNSVNQIASQMKAVTEAVISRIEYLGAYETSFGGSYIGTTLGFTVANPSKVGILKIFDKIEGVVGDLVRSVLNGKINKLPSGYVTKYATLTEKVTSQFPEDMQEHIFSRMAIMDDNVLKSNLDNPEVFVKSFSDGKYPVLISERLIDVTRYLSNLSYKNGKFYDDNYLSYGTEFVAHGVYLLTLQKGKIKLVHKLNQENLDIKHSHIVSNGNVEFAGEIYFDNGILVGFDKSSGHYKPNSTSSNNVKNAINNLGYNGNINFMDTIGAFEGKN